MSLLSLEEIALRAENGEDEAELLKHLDVKSIHFGPTLCDEAESNQIPPLVQTNVVGGGPPMTGILTHDPVKALQLAESGTKAVWVADKDYFNKWIALRLPPRVGYLYLPEPDSTRTSFERSMEAHVRLRAAFRSFLIDKAPPKAFFTREKGVLRTVKDGLTLEEGSEITIDPALGRVWNGRVPFQTPSTNELENLSFLEKASLRLEQPMITGALSDLSNQAYFFEMGGFPEGKTIGLYRTESGTREALKQQFPNRTLGAAYDQCFSLERGSISSATLWWANRHLNFRLPDLRSVEDLFHPRFTSALQRGKDHEVGSIAFKTKLAFYRNILRVSFDQLSDKRKPQVLATVTAPDIWYSQEAAAIGAMVREEATRAGLEKQISYAVMMERLRAMPFSSAIARHCSRLCYGTNDLTADITGLRRDEPDYADWMRAHGFRGHSPFAFLIPEVRRQVARSVVAARRGNPDIQISFCGQQMAGADIPALFFACNLGVDQIVVPAVFNARYRALGAALVHAARTGRLSPTPRPVQDDYWKRSLKLSLERMDR